jgi:hypothetical protein
MLQSQNKQAGDGFNNYVPGLSSKAQFWWGFFGGWIIVAFRLYLYASVLPINAPWPNLCFKTCVQCGFWLLFPVISGFLSRVCEPHHRLIAVFEGASAPALFLFLAKDFHL